jgi:hypothetical protein
MNRLTETKVFSTIQSSVVLYGVSKGLGRAVDLISPAELQAVEKVGHHTDSSCALMEVVLLGLVRK